MEATTTHRVGTTAIAVFLVAFVACAIPAATATGAVPMDTRAKPCGCSWTVEPAATYAGRGGGLVREVLTDSSAIPRGRCRRRPQVARLAATRPSTASRPRTGHRAR